MRECVYSDSVKDKFFYWWYQVYLISGLSYKTGADQIKSIKEKVSLVSEWRVLIHSESKEHSNVFIYLNLQRACDRCRKKCDIPPHTVLKNPFTATDRTRKGQFKLKYDRDWKGRTYCSVFCVLNSKRTIALVQHQTNILESHLLLRIVCTVEGYRGNCFVAWQDGWDKGRTTWGQTLDT